MRIKIFTLENFLSEKRKIHEINSSSDAEAFW